VNQVDPVVLWASSDAVGLFADGAVVRIDGLSPDTVIDGPGWSARTLPDLGARVASVATVNDVHFGETECGRIDGTDLGPILSVPPGAEPYPAMMSRCAIAEMAALDPDLVVVKGDLTDAGRPEEFDAFLAAYGGAFGDRLCVVRGNHDGSVGAARAGVPVQVRHLAGVTVVVLDTSRQGQANGTLDADQLEALDVIGADADGPVLVFGHHPLYDARTEARNDDVFVLRPDPSDALLATMVRRPHLVAYLAGHTHRNRVVWHEGIPFVEVGATKDYPGNWAEYQVRERGIIGIVHRIGAPEAVAWTEQTKVLYNGTYEAHALGTLADRSMVLPYRWLTAGVAAAG
jgi:3',5'-cyclic-AMP phosphodiesterase